MIVEMSEDDRASYMAREPTQVLTYNMQNSQPRKIWIVEGGYCTDTRYADKYRRKQTQHEVLTHLLQARGFEVHVLPMMLCFAGSIYKTFVSALSTLGTEGSKAKKVLQNWHVHSVQTHHSIIKLRRSLVRMPSLNNKKRARDTIFPYKPS